MNFLRDPLLDTIMGIIVTIIVALTVYWFQQNKKQISYEILSNAPILGIKAEHSEKLRLIYDGNLVEEGYLIVLKISNSGNVPIATTDYEHPISFGFSEKAKLLDATVLETNPNNIIDEVSVKYISGNLIIAPLLLNKGDFVTLRLIIDHFDGEITAKARIIGVNKIKQIHLILDTYLSYFVMIFVLNLFVVALSLFIIFTGSFDLGIAGILSMPIIQLLILLAFKLFNCIPFYPLKDVTTFLRSHFFRSRHL